MPDLHPAFTLLDEAPFGRGALRVRRLRLDANGLGLLLLRDPAAPVVAYRTWLSVGSAVERPGKTGLAHLFEHLLFKGTPAHPDGELDALMEAAGASTNAQTWFDYTAYQEELPAAELRLALELEPDRFANLALDDEEVRAELEVVKNERRMAVDNDVDGTLEEELFRLAFRHHPYGAPTIGWMDDLEGLTPDDARAFYRRYYAPDRALLVVVGDFDEAWLCTEVAARYGGLVASTERGRPRDPAPAEQPIEAERRIEIERPCAADRLRIGWHAPALSDPDHARLEVLLDALFGGPSSLVYRTLVVERQIASDAWASATPTHDPGLLDVGANLQRGHDATEALAVIDEALASVAARGLGEHDLVKARNRLESRLYYGLRDVAARADALGLYQTVTGDYHALLTLGEAYAATSAEDCARLAARLTPSVRAVAIAHPAADVGDDIDHDHDGGAR